MRGMAGANPAPAGLAQPYPSSERLRRPPVGRRPPPPGGEGSDGAPRLAAFGLELKLLAADVAAEVGDGRIVRQLRSAVGGAVGTEAVQRDPGLGHRSRGLGRPLEDDGRFGEAELAPVIVVLPQPPTVAGRWSGG